MSNIIQPTDPKVLKKLENGIKELSDSKIRVEAEKALTKDIVETLSEDCEVPKKYINKLATAYHKQSISEILADAEDFEILYDSVFGKNE
jgi:soluble P-type ATPase